MTDTFKYYTKLKRRRCGPEACLQYAVVEHLRLTATPGTIYFSIPNEAKRSLALGAHMKRMGMLSGAADLYIGVPGQPPAFMELKAKGEKQTENQIAFEQLCHRNGSRYWVVDNIDDALS